MTVRHGYRRHRQGRTRYEPANPLARLMRRTCSVCDAPVQWLPVDQAAEVLGVEVFTALLAQMGGVGVPAGSASLDVWRCSSCDQCGVLGPMDQGWS